MDFSNEILCFFFFSFKIPTTQQCHVQRECLNAPRANAYLKYGFVIIKRTVKKARMSFSHVHRQTARMDNLVVDVMSSIRHFAFHLIKNVIWLSIVWMEVMKRNAVSLLDI